MWKLKCAIIFIKPAIIALYLLSSVSPPLETADKFELMCGILNRINSPNVILLYGLCWYPSKSEYEVMMEIQPLHYKVNSRVAQTNVTLVVSHLTTV
jgi:hypothetical protein